jgi:hypothetical protein
MPIVVLVFTILAVTSGAVVVILRSSLPLKYHLAIEVVVCAIGLLAAASIGGICLFQATWPDGPERPYALVVLNAAGLALAVFCPFAVAVFLIHRHRRSRL